MVSFVRRVPRGKTVADVTLVSDNNQMLPRFSFQRMMVCELAGFTATIRDEDATFRFLHNDDDV